MGKKRSSKKRRKTGARLARIVLGNIIVIALILAIIYFAVAFYFRSHFYPNTTFNGVSIGMKTCESAEALVSDNLSYYELIITGRDGNADTLSGPSIGLTLPDDGLLEETLSNQNSFTWIINLFEKHEAHQDFTDSYDADLFEEALLALSLFDEETVIVPEDAQLVYSEDEGKYIVSEEVTGTELIYENVAEKAAAAVSELAMEITLTDDDYTLPSVTADDADLNAAADNLNRYVTTTITYTIEGADVIDSDTISEWLTVDDDFNVTIDEDAIADYVQTLATKYNTYADERQFVTSLGDTITIGGGDYGWVIDKSGEAAQIIEDIESEETDIEREPVFEQTAFVDSFTDDIGSTYIELDYTNQHMYYYVDGELILESDFVSGKLSNGNGSPDGIFKIVYKEKDATLEGENYSSAVSYFMPFAYNVGLHDASWRSSFGGEIYKSSGSHGCINLPSDIAEELYSLVEVGTPVVAYYRESVELTSYSAGVSNAYSYVDE